MQRFPAFLTLIVLLLGAGHADARRPGSRGSVGWQTVYKPPYLGAVGTRGRLYDLPFTGPAATLNARSYSYIRATTRSLVIKWAGWYTDVSTGADTPNGSNLTISNAYVETVPGTCVPLTFGGSTSGTVVAGSDLQSDPLPGYWKAGQKIFIWTFLSAQTNFSYGGGAAVPYNDTANGDALTYLSAVDLGATCVPFADTGIGQIYPTAILGKTRAPTVLGIGDSRMQGQGDTYTGTSGDLGQDFRSIGPAFGYINFGRSGVLASQMTNGNRASYKSYATHVIQELGGNDILTGANAPQVLTRVNAIYSFFPGKTLFQDLITPVSTSTNGWVDTANQTTVASNGVRVSTNNTFSLHGIPVRGVFEIPNATESSRNSGLWAVGAGATAYTADGTHGNNAVSLVTQASKVINPAAIRRCSGMSVSC